MRASKSGFSLLEGLLALFIILLGAVISTAIINNIARFSAKQRALDVTMNLESYLNEALLNADNYRASMTDLNAGNVPAHIEFFVNPDSSHHIKIAEVDAAGASRVYFDSNHNPCAKDASPDCIYYSELSWENSSVPYKLKFSVSVDDPKKKFVLSKNEQSLLIPTSLYSDISQLKCPNDGEKYLGIKSFDSTTGAVECWHFDKSVACPVNSYPLGLKIKTAASNELVLNCQPLLEFKCPQNFAPYKDYPFDPHSLTGACISIMAEAIAPRFGHLSDNVKSSQPPNPNNYYGLKWVTAKLCPSGYKLQAKTSSALGLANDLKELFIVNDSTTKLQCSSLRPVCGETTDGVYCDACPVSDPTMKDGCVFRTFPAAPDQVLDPTCRDPKLFALKSSGVNSILQNYECRLSDSLKYADGIPVEVSATNAN